MTIEQGTRLGPYEVLAPLGAGGMGEVYRARDTRLDRLVAIKVVQAGASPQALERFAREAKTIAALNHPGICAIYDVGTEPVPYLVMELLDGETLHKRLTRGSLDVPTVIEIGIVLADALAAAHAKGVVHRDLKPANIVLTPRGPKVLDFGLARITESPAASDSDVSSQLTMPAEAPLTDHGVAVGTLAYMSPEQLRGEALDARTDLFSIGVVFYEMATGRRAFAGTTSAVTSAAILHEQPAAPRDVRPDLPTRLEETILTLLEKDRDVRTQTAAELRADLTRLKRELGGARASDAVARTAVPTAATASGSAQVSLGAAPPSSSDAQLMAGIVQRHRGAVLGVAALAILAVAAAAYIVAPRKAESAAGADAAALSIADLKVEVLTTTGTAVTPAVSPDGKYVVYVENGGGRDSLRVRQVATGSNVEIVPAEPGVVHLGATVTPDGAFVNYVKQAPPQPPELWQVPFLGGTPRRLLPGVGGRVAFSPDGRRMAFTRAGPALVSELVVADSDGANQRVVAARKPPDLFSLVAVRQSFAPAWSPDGATLAAMGGRNGDPPAGQIVFVDVETGAERPVNTPSRGLLPGTGLAWLDGRTLILSMIERPSAPLQLWTLSYPEGSFRRLSNDTDYYVSPSLTADRGALAVARNDGSVSIWTTDAAKEAWTQTVPTTPIGGPIGFRLRWVGDGLIYTAKAAGGFGLTKWDRATRRTEVLAPSSGNPSVSRDGAVLTYFDYDAAEHWKADAAGRNRVLLGRGYAGRDAAKLSPDGRLVAMLVPGPNGPAVRVQSMDDPSQERNVTSDRVRGGGGGGGGAEISPNGRSIAFPSIDDRKQPAIAICDLDACSSRKTVPARGTNLRWTPDGLALAYVDLASQDIWAQPIDGGAPRQLTHLPSDGLQTWDFDWSADGTRLAVARGRLASDIVLFRGLRPPGQTKP